MGGEALGLGDQSRDPACNIESSPPCLDRRLQMHINAGMPASDTMRATATPILILASRGLGGDGDTGRARVSPAKRRQALQLGWAEHVAFDVRTESLAEHMKFFFQVVFRRPCQAIVAPSAGYIYVHPRLPSNQGAMYHQAQRFRNCDGGGLRVTRTPPPHTHPRPLTPWRRRLRFSFFRMWARLRKGLVPPPAIERASPSHSDSASRQPSARPNTCDLAIS